MKASILALLLTASFVTTCEDENEHCSSWAAEGECEKNPGYMHQHCQKACGVCGDSCVDKHDKCALWAREGECDANPEWMHANCAKSCGVCEGGGEPEPPCEDGHAQCSVWAAKGECDNNPGWMKDNCKKSCGVCGGGNGGGDDGGQDCDDNGGNVGDVVNSQTACFIVKKHNALRGQVQPPASNMLRMRWNENLARSANSFIQGCPNWHDSNEDRESSTGLGILIGQNMAWNIPGWSAVVQAWYDEVKYFHYGGPPSGVTGHFTQLTNARTGHVGCAYRQCSGTMWQHYYVCNYAYMPLPNSTHPHLDETQRPWRSGTPCSECGGKCSGNLCDCGDKLCQNGGTLNTRTCTCDCHPLYKGALCEQVNCPASDGEACNNWWPPSYCNQFPNVKEDCPYMCGLC